MDNIVRTVRRPAAPGEEIRNGQLVTYVALWHGAVGYYDLVVATDGRRYALREVPSVEGGPRRWSAVRRYEPCPRRRSGPPAVDMAER